MKDQLKVVSNFQIAEYPITPTADYVKAELSGELKEAKQFIEYL